MEVRFENSFLRDVKAIKDQTAKRDLERLLIKVKEVESLSEIQGVKKIKGYRDYYRIKIKNYRVGIKLQGSVVIFVRVLSRKDIYRYFP